MRWWQRQVEAARAERVARRLMADKVLGATAAAVKLREAARLIRSRKPEEQAAGMALWRG